MSLRDVRAAERNELLTTLRAVGHDAPTLCEGWTAIDVAAHLSMSEQALGLPMFVANGVRRVLPARVMQRAIASAQASGDRLHERMKARGWDAVLGRLAGGPPPLYRIGTLAHVRLVEEWIHHEDVRRGAGLDRRPSSPALDDALWQAGLTVARFPEFRSGRDGIEIIGGERRRFALGDDVHVRVTGAPGELLLFLAGRRDADVDATGDSATLEALRSRLTV